MDVASGIISFLNSLNASGINGDISRDQAPKTGTFPYLTVSDRDHTVTLKGDAKVMARTMCVYVTLWQAWQNESDALRDLIIDSLDALSGLTLNNLGMNHKVQGVRLVDARRLPSEEYDAVQLACTLWVTYMTT